MKDYKKPEVEYIDFSTEAVTTGTDTDYGHGTDDI